MGAGVTQSETRVVISDWDGLLKYIVSSSGYNTSTVLYMKTYVKVKLKESRKRPSVAQRVTGGLGSQIS
jgi:hypothetical protein